MCETAATFGILLPLVNQMKQHISRRKYIKALLRLFVLCLTLPIVSNAERLSIKLYTSADGLGSGFIDFLMLDSRGFMWFCTRDGLSRFDGSEFITYQIGDANSGPGVESIYETRNGTYWIGTTGGLYRFSPNVLTTPKTTKNGRPILNAEYVGGWRGRIFEDRNGKLWIGTGGFYSLDEKDGKVRFTKVQLNLPPETNKDYGVGDIHEAADGSFWFNTTFGAVRRLPDGRVIFYPYNDSLSSGVTDLEIDNKHRVWLRRGLKLFVVNPEPIESLSGLGQTTVKDLMSSPTVKLKTEDEIKMPEKAGEIFELVDNDYFNQWALRNLYKTSDGHVWVTTEKDLFEYDGRVFHRYNSSQGLIPGMARMAEDAAGNLWFGGTTALIRLDRKGLRSYGESDGLISLSVSAITESTDGTIYVSNGDFALSKLEGTNFRSVKLNISPTARSLWTSRNAFIDSRGEYWFLTNEKLYRFAAVSNFEDLNLRQPLKGYTVRDGLNGNSAFQIFEDKRGDIWVSTRGNPHNERGLARWNRAEDKFYAFSKKEDYPSGKSVSAFAEDNNGNIWFGFYEGGLARYSNGRFTVFSEKDSLPGGVIGDLHTDREGRLWIASARGGLRRLDDTNAEHPQFTIYTIDDGLSSNNVRTITEDFYGNIYIGTARGVDRLTIKTKQIKHFSVSDGLAADFVVDSHCDKNGTLWFATMGGLSKLVPLQGEKPSPPQIWLSNLQISGLQQPVSELGSTEIRTPELAYTQNNFQINFFGLDFRAGETLRYQYKLEGANADWSSPTEQRTVTFANLQPGTYRFLVRAVNSDGISSEKPAVISFRILPPVWMRWWFISLVVLLTGALFYLFYRYRIARLREVNVALLEAKNAEEKLRKSREERLAELESVRTRIATDLHDDIGASLTQIAILSEVAQQQQNKKANGKNGNGGSEPLTMIYDVSNELVSTMSDIVWAINPRKDHLHDLTLRMRRFASDVLVAREIDFEFEDPEENEDISLSSNLRREVFLIFKESINNIVKHSRATEVEIEFTIADKYLTLVIKDNGRGFNAQNLFAHSSENLFADYRGGNGLSSMRKRASEMGGEFEIYSAHEKGTRIKLHLPLEQHLSNKYEPTI